LLGVRHHQDKRLDACCHLLHGRCACGTELDERPDALIEDVEDPELEARQPLRHG